MDLRAIIAGSADISDDLVVYAKKIDGRFLSSSEAILLALTGEELEMTVDEIAARKCPGFSYFLEMFLISELIQDFENSDVKSDVEQKIEKVIHYAEFDA